MEGFFRIALRPLRHFADFRGRSTRTELVAFYLLIMLTGTVAGLLSAVAVAAFGFPDPGFNDVMDVVWLIFLCPLLALAVRRFHDHGKSAWWLLILLPQTVLKLREAYLHGWRDWSGTPDVPLAVGIPLVLLLLVFYGLLLWKDDEGTNRYGPNPRYDAPSEPEPSPMAAAGPQLP